LTTSQVDVHSVLYLPSSRSLFKKPKLDSAPSVHISVLYPKSRGSENLFSEWTRITKLLDPVMKPLDVDEVDYNDGVCRLGHRGGRHEAYNEEKTCSGCECLGQWKYHRGCACKFEPSSALHPCRLAANTTCSELHCHIYHELFSIHCHAILVPFHFPVMSAAGRYIQLKHFSHD
jgi:hypothetical protein